MLATAGLQLHRACRPAVPQHLFNKAAMLNETLADAHRNQCQHHQERQGAAMRSGQLIQVEQRVGRSSVHSISTAPA